MKLNNHGWGFKEMIIMTSILLILLLIASYYIVVLYSSLGATPGSVYDRLENKIVIAAKMYVKNVDYTDLVTADELKDLGYLDSFYDFNGDKCTGYVLINNEYNPYIKCKRYKTRGYSLKYDK